MVNLYTPLVPFCFWKGSLCELGQQQSFQTYPNLQSWLIERVKYFFWAGVQSKFCADVEWFKCWHVGVSTTVITPCSMDAPMWYKYFDHWWVKFLLTRRAAMSIWEEVFVWNQFILPESWKKICFGSWRTTNSYHIIVPSVSIQDLPSAIVPCGSFHSYQVRRFAQDGQMEKAEASEVDLPCHSISPKMKEPWMKRINLHGSTKILRTYFRDLGPAWFEGGNQMSWWKLDGTPQNTLTFHRRKPPEWVDTHHKDSQTSKKVSPYHDFQTL